jgi:hypothetical protein
MNKNHQDTSWMFPRPAAQPVIAPQIDPSILEKATRPAQQHNQITTLLTAALAVGGATALISLIFSALVIYAAHAHAPFVWLLIPLSIAAGLVVAAVLSIIWTREAATRAWRLEDEDRSFYFQRLADAQDQVNQQLDAAFSNAPQPPTDAERLRLAGYNILNYHFTTGKPATRPECETDLGITQAEWNAVNKILIELGVKGDRKWLVGQTDVLNTLIKWQRCVDIRPDGRAWVKDKPDQSQWRLIDL